MLGSIFHQYADKYKKILTDKLQITGIAVVAVMVLTTFFVSLIMMVIWKTSIWAISLFFVVFGTVEIIYLSSVLYKFKEGGYLPLAFSAVLMLIMGIWHYVHVKRYMFELQNKVSSDYIKDLSSNPDINRIPGIALLYSELVQGIPPIFPHFIGKIPSVHSIVVFVSIKHIPICKVIMEERFLFRQIEPREYRMFRCVVRYGYNDAMEEPMEFERQLVEHLKEFVEHECFLLEPNDHTEKNNTTTMSETTVVNPNLDIVNNTRSRGGSATVHTEEPLQQLNTARVSNASIQSGIVHHSTGSMNSSNRIISGPIQGADEELQFIQRAMDRGVVYLLGEADVKAGHRSSIVKKVVVDYAYSFIRKNFRQGEQIMAIPRERLLRVGMTYEI